MVYVIKQAIYAEHLIDEDRMKRDAAPQTSVQLGSCRSQNAETPINRGRINRAPFNSAIINRDPINRAPLNTAPIDNMAPIVRGLIFL